VTGGTPGGATGTFGLVDLTLFVVTIPSALNCELTIIYFNIQMGEVSPISRALLGHPQVEERAA